MSSTKAPGLRSASTGAAAAVAATAAASSSSSTSSVEKIAPPSITASEQALAACSGSVITSVLMTPFDVVKVRQQAWAHNSHNSSFAVVGRVVRAEGVSSLWSGLTPTLLMSVLKQNKPQKKKHGFKTRMKTKDGRKIIKARRRKGRKQLGYGQ